MIAVSALGFPLLFLLYLHETDIDDDLPVSSLALTAALGVGLGVGWALLTGSIVAHSYDVALSDGTSEGHSIIEGLVIPAGSALLMVLPAVVVRLLRPATRESLDGFVVGALSAIAFVASATLTRLAPQLATGPTAKDQPVSELLAEAGIQGVAMPLTAAAAGGLVGVALWFNRPVGMDRRPAVVLLVSSFLVVLGICVALGLMEVAPFTNGLHFGVHVLAAVVALLALRIGVQAALLYEPHDEMNPEAQVLCPHCDHVVPDTAFCPNCGVATRAASRTARAIRRTTEDIGVPAARPGYAVPAGSYAVVPVRHTTHTGLLTALGAGAAVAAAAAVTVSVLATPVVPRYVCPPDCGQPPIGKPVETNPWFRSSDARFSVQYPRAGTAYEVTFVPDGVDVNFTAGDTGTMQFYNGLRDSQRSGRLSAGIRCGQRRVPAGCVGHLHAAAGAGDGRNQKELCVGRVRDRPVPRIQPGFRQWPPVRGQHATGIGYGQVREQLYLARQLAALASLPVRVRLVEPIDDRDTFDDPVAKSRLWRRSGRNVIRRGRGRHIGGRRRNVCGCGR